MEPDPHIVCSPHRHVGRSNPSAALQPKPWSENFPMDASMDKYKKQQQQQHEFDFRRKRPADEGRRTKMRRERETTESNNNDSSGTNSNSTSSSLLKQPRHNGEGGGRSRGRSPRTGFDPQTEEKLYKTSVRTPNLPPRRPENEKKVNWRLACFMSHEYLTRGTLLGRPWPPQDSNPQCRYEKNDKSEPRSSCLDQEGDESKREKERLYLTLADFLRTGDVHLPGIVNPSQLAAWLGLN